MALPEWDHLLRARDCAVSHCPVIQFVAEAANNVDDVDVRFSCHWYGASTDGRA